MSNYDHLQRQFDILPVEFLSQPIVIIGAGAIGSFTALALVKMGFENVTIYDDDSVEIENMNSQFYRRGDISAKKVEALSALIEDFTGVVVSARPQRFENQLLNGVVISAVDSMSSRKAIWDKAKNLPSVRLVIDPRMGGEQGQIYTVDPRDEKQSEAYESTLFSDGEAVQERCTAKSTMYTVLLISGMIGKIVKDLVMDKSYSKMSFLNISANNYETFPSPEPKL